MGLSKIHLYLVFQNKYGMSRGMKLLILLLLFYRINGLSQQLSHQVLVPAAGLATAGVINYSHSIGETAIEIISGSGFIFTQGFQQPGFKVTAETPHEGTGVDVYPNPATDFINIKLFGDVARKFTIDLINITGTYIRSIKMDFITDYYYIQQIEIKDLKAGLYFVRVISDDRKIKRIFKIEKM